jgi:hypothetical protein
MRSSPDGLSPRALRDLGRALIARAEAAEQAYPEPFVTARRQLSPEGVERLIEIVSSGSTPTLGFWLRYRAPAT